MDLLDMFISGAVIAAVFIGAPRLWKLGKQKQAETISNGKVYYGLLYCRILLFYLAGVVSGEMIFMILLGNSIEGTVALLMTLISGIPFAALYTYLYRKNFIKKYLSQNKKD